jgi:hypothetical protein
MLTIFLFCNTGKQTKVYACTKQVFYHWASSPALECFLYISLLFCIFQGLYVKHIAPFCLENSITLFWKENNNWVGTVVFYLPHAHPPIDILMNTWKGRRVSQHKSWGMINNHIPTLTFLQLIERLWGRTAGFPPTLNCLTLPQ